MGSSETVQVFTDTEGRHGQFSRTEFRKAGRGKVRRWENGLVGGGLNAEIKGLALRLL